MAKTSIENLFESNLQDLIIPVDDALMNPYQLMLLTSLVLMICVACLVILWRWNNARKTPKQLAIRKLKQLQLTIISPKIYVLKLSRILREGLEIPRLESLKLNTDQTEQWQEFIDVVESACYSKQDNPIDIESLTNQAIHWLEET